MYNIHRDTILSSIRIFFSKSFTNISYFTPDVNSNFHFVTKSLFQTSLFVTKSLFQTSLLLLPTILLGYIPIPEFNYQNNYSYPTSTRHIYTRQPTLFLCVCNYFNSQLTPRFLCAQIAGMHTGFVGQCDETSIAYCILGYRVYRIGITIKIITLSLPPDIVTTYSCILTTKIFKRIFKKGLQFRFRCAIIRPSKANTQKTFRR